MGIVYKVSDSEYYTLSPQPFRSYDLNWQIFLNSLNISQRFKCIVSTERIINWMRMPVVTPSNSCHMQAYTSTGMNTHKSCWRVLSELTMEITVELVFISCSELNRAWRLHFCKALANKLIRGQVRSNLQTVQNYFNDLPHSRKRTICLGLICLDKKWEWFYFHTPTDLHRLASNHNNTPLHRKLRRILEVSYYLRSEVLTSRGYDRMLLISVQ
jgi:hypothetical protein